MSKPKSNYFEHLQFTRFLLLIRVATTPFIRNGTITNKPLSGITKSGHLGLSRRYYAAFNLLNFHKR
jgi:hypothetical protein